MENWPGFAACVHKKSLREGEAIKRVEGDERRPARSIIGHVRGGGFFPERFSPENQVNVSVQSRRPSFHPSFFEVARDNGDNYPSLLHLTKAEDRLIDTLRLVWIDEKTREGGGGC